MSLGYLLDTNVFSAALAPQPALSAVEWIDAREAEIATAAPVLHELMYGYRRLQFSHRRRIIETYITDYLLPHVPVLAYDTQAADWHAAERARLTGMGQTPPYIDGQIAAIAATNRLTLVTANTVDFQNFAGLRVIDWWS